MKRALVLAALALLVFPACGKKKHSPEFEKKWQTAKKNAGSEGVQVIDLRASALKGNVQRLGEPTPPPEVGGERKLPIKLSQNQVGRYIRRQVARLHRCQGETKGKSGRALITVQIMPSGRVAEVDVNAPAFSGTRMAGCLQQGAMRWRFPAFQEGPLSYTFPFIFR